jgi:hypothetical protein
VYPTGASTWRIGADIARLDAALICRFCGAKFVESGEASTLREGYATADAYRWVCPDCFEDFRERFGWPVDATVNLSMASSCQGAHFLRAVSRVSASDGLCSG